MKNYEEFFARLNFNFSKIPEYKKNEHLGEILSTDILISFNFYDNSDNPVPLSSLINEQELLILSVGISQSLKYLVKIIEEIKCLENGESTNNLAPFISINNDLEDLGIWFTFTRKEDNKLLIQIDFKANEKEKFLIRTNYSQFYSAMMDFANLILELIKNINNIPEKYRESVSIQLYYLIASIPLE